MSNKKHESPDELWASYRASVERLRRNLARLKAENEAAKGQQSPDPAPEPKQRKAPKMPAKMRKAVAKFDAMSDADQVAALREVWGE